MQFLKHNKMLFIYSVALALLFLLLKLVEYRLLIIDHSIEIYAGSIAILFTLLGIWLSRKLFSPKKETLVIEKETIVEREVFVTGQHAFEPNKKALKETDLSARELEVLQLIAGGMSNQEIANAMYVSVNTVKTHIANLFYKLEVSRRTQAVEKAKKLSIIP
ncbi:MAG TPA: LuxR C-terminal-related transcriptional regulator [Panacibacter sp.]|nr:LuxR C-terminal-related transcriptional regulator [Panacibacter sp.]HNP44343.1 LuxR C-terminal-related transcriptional regulator [Panacibacter sp.]